MRWQDDPAHEEAVRISKKRLASLTLEKLKMWDKRHNAICSRGAFCSQHQPGAPLS